jgi:hypothetical protein
MNLLSTGFTTPLPLPAMLLRTAMARVRGLVRPTRVRTGQSLSLERNALHRVRRPLGRTITCESGALWLTFDNTLQDVVLEAGESHACIVGTRLLIQALQGSRLHVD